MSLSNRVAPNRTVRMVFLEAFLIVLGVLMAYASTAWYESRQEEEAASVALTSILEELKENRTSVLGSLEYHTTVRDELYGAMRAGSPPPRSAFPRGYVGPAEILTTAWDLAHARGAIVTLPYQEVLSLSQTYADQRSYAATSRQVGDLIYTAIFREGSQSILTRYPNLLEVVMTLLYRECQLLMHQGEVLASFGAELTPAPEAEASCREMLGR